jgi:putative endonuclease
VSLEEVLLMDKQPAVYILASGRNGTLYTGVTSDLIARAWQHKLHLADGFTASYRVECLVWYELHGTMESAILREKRIKKWRRAWKIELIEAMNPYWNDLWDDIMTSGKDTGSPLARG